MGRRTGVGQADEDDLRLHAKVAGARVQRRLERVARVQAAAHTFTPCQSQGHENLIGVSPGIAWGNLTMLRLGPAQCPCAGMHVKAGMLPS